MIGEEKKSKTLQFRNYYPLDATLVESGTAALPVQPVWAYNHEDFNAHKEPEAEKLIARQDDLDVKKFLEPKLKILEERTKFAIFEILKGELGEWNISKVRYSILFYRLKHEYWYLE